MKTIVVIGSGNSGSGAIHDYLLSNTKYKSPFKGKEFRLIDDPDGILNLYNNFYVNCSINNPSNAIMRFENYIQNLIALKMRINDKNVNIYNKKILSLSNDYIKSITTLNYNAFPEFMAVQTSYLTRKYLNIKKNIFNIRYNPSSFKMYLPVKKEIFFKKTKLFLLKLIKLQLNNKNLNYVVLDQTLNIWNFTDIFLYFNNVKIILVTRDPRGVYYSMKSRHSAAYPGHNLKLWTKWYGHIMQKFFNYKKKIDKKNKKHILEIKFEDFVTNYDGERKKILKFISAEEIDNKFNLKKSKFNAFKFNEKLTKFEKKYIKKKLKMFLHR